MTTPALSQLLAWNTDHLGAAAQSWNETADRWESAFTSVNVESAAPAGSSWQGVAADKAFNRTHHDRMRVIATSDSLRNAASIAATGMGRITSARSLLVATVERARKAGFHVDDDWSVWDTRSVTTAAARTVRDRQGLAFADDIRARSADLVATDRYVAARLTAAGAGFQGLTFPQAPLPQEPQPPPVPFPPYQPKVWSACKLRGADPDKEVRTFNRAALNAGFRTLPAGDSTLFCGNDKYGFIHLRDKHGDQWQSFELPGTGNWRNVADYAIGAALAYPETVQYRQDNDTFAVERAIYPTNAKGEITGPSTWKVHVVVSASDGKIITAYPISTR